MHFLFHSVTGKEIKGPTVVHPYSRFYPDSEVLETVRIHHALFREMARWITDQGGRPYMELVATVPGNEEAVLIDVPDDLAVLFKLRWS